MNGERHARISTRGRVCTIFIEAGGSRRGREGYKWRKSKREAHIEQRGGGREEGEARERKDQAGPATAPITKALRPICFSALCLDAPAPPLLHRVISYERSQRKPGKIRHKSENNELSCSEIPQRSLPRGVGELERGEQVDDVRAFASLNARV